MEPSDWDAECGVAVSWLEDNGRSLSLESRCIPPPGLRECECECEWECCCSICPLASGLCDR